MNNTIFVPTFTSYYGNFRNFPENYMMVSSSLAVPPLPEKTNKMRCNVHWDKIAPTPKILKEYKQSDKKLPDILKYTRSYVKNVLIPYTGLYDDFMRIQTHAIRSGASTILVSCYEKLEDFCHRRVWAEYMHQTYNFNISEYKEVFEHPVRHIDAAILLAIREEVKKTIKEEFEL